MAVVYVTFRVMPESPEVDLSSLQEKVKKKVIDFGGNIAKVEEKPMAFGLKSLDVIFSMKEEKGSTDQLEDEVREIEGVNSVEVTDVRRAIG